MITILLLGHNIKPLNIINALEEKGCSVKFRSEKIKDYKEIYNYDFIISYGYRHIIKQECIEKINNPIINLHISYLPFNRGAHPNFWSFYDETPSGVSIHLVDSGIDTGPILFQKKISFDKEKTFSETYIALKKEIEKLFLMNVDNILKKNWSPIKQKNKGTFHSLNDLPSSFKGWDSNIHEEITRLKKETLKNI